MQFLDSNFRFMKALEVIANSSSIEIQDLIMTNDGLTNCLSNVTNVNFHELIMKFINGEMENALELWPDVSIIKVVLESSIPKVCFLKISNRLAKTKMSLICYNFCILCKT